MPLYKMTDENGKPIKKDGKQKYRVRVNYNDNMGKPKQVDRVAYGADEAKQLERELTYSLKQEKPTHNITVENLYNEYVLSKQSEVRESSLRKTKQIIRIHILPTFKDVRLDKLTLPAIQAWKNDIESNPKNYGIVTKKNIYGEFRALLNYGVKMEYISNNPLIKVGNFKAPLQQKKEMLFYTPEEFKKYITAAKKHCEKADDDYQWNYYVFFCIAFYMGMRKGEIYALQWKDIKADTISITKSIYQNLNGGDKITAPKNRSSIREIEIPKPLQDILTAHRERCMQYDWFTDDSYVCGGYEPIRNTSVQVSNKRFAKAGNVKQIRLHDFRHSHASLLINEGINIQEVARRLGHSDIQTTLKTYAHLYPRESERAIKVLNRVKIV